VTSPLLGGGRAPGSFESGKSFGMGGTGYRRNEFAWGGVRIFRANRSGGGNGPVSALSWKTWKKRCDGLS